MRKTGIFSRIIAIFLTICILFGCQGLRVIADGLENDEKLSRLYVSEVKMFYAESPETAKMFCEEEGFTFCPKNLAETTGSEFQAYLGYKTSENEYDAITDLSLLDMKNSHFTEMSYEQFLDKYMSEFEDQAYRMKALAGEFRKKYLAGSPYAQMAYDTLNMFYMDEDAPMSDGNLLGNFMLEEVDAVFFEKFLQRGDAQVLSAIVNALCGAAADYSGDGEDRETWVDRAKKSAITEIYAKADSAERAQYDTLYRGPAMELYSQILRFAETYREARERLDTYGSTFGYDEADGITAESGAEELLNASPNCRIPEYTGALMTYELFDQIVYQEAGEKIVSDADYLYGDDGTDAAAAEEEYRSADEEADEAGTADETMEEAADEADMADENAGEPAEETSGEAAGENRSEEVYTESVTLAEYLLRIADDKDTALHLEVLYPIVAGMSQAQIIAMELCGLAMIAKGLSPADDYAADRQEILRSSEENLKELGYENGKMYLWEGVDRELYSKKVVETSDEIEARLSGKKYVDSINADARQKASDKVLALQIIDISLLAASGFFLVLQAAIGTSLWQAGTTMFMASSLALTAGSAFLYGLTGVLLSSLYVLNIAVTVVSFVFMVYMLLDQFGVFDVPDRVNYAEIPGVVFHAREKSDGYVRLRYDAVGSNADPASVARIMVRMLYKDDPDRVERYDQQILEKYRSGENADKTGRYPWEPGSGFVNQGEYNMYDVFFLEGFDDIITKELKMRADAADLGGFQGRDDRWLALYTTKAPAAGSPITVAPGESFFKVQDNDANAPAGTRAVTLMSGRHAADIHSVEVNEKTGTPAYMFIIRDSESAAEGQEEGLPDEQKEEEKEEQKTDSDSYITRVRLSHAATREQAQNALRAEGFLDIIDMNLSPYDGYTFIGFQYGSAANAITDIRVSSSGLGTQMPVVFGEASYARCGVDGAAGMTPDGLALYATSSREAGTPIKKITVENKRYELGEGPEPVCLFSGGNAVDFKHKWSDNLGINLQTYHTLLGREHIHTGQEDLDDGLYIYFWPKEEFKAEEDDEGAPYIAGFSYFMAMKTGNDENTYGDNEQYMQAFAAENGFTLIEDGSSPALMMSEAAGTMSPLAHWQDCEGGALGHDWRYDIYHYLYRGSANNFSDMAIDAKDNARKMYENEKFSTRLYFGVSYTYNPYRAITDVAGLVAPYTETTRSIRLTGMTTPAGTLQVSSLSIQGIPLTYAGISYGYYNAVNMENSIYTNDAVMQSSDLYWLKDARTETLSRYLLTNGPAKGKEPIRADEMLFLTYPDPGNITGYVPVCDMRTPGDYSHPMNFALDTTDLGSEYLYLYLKKNAGGRTGDADGDHHTYSKKRYVAAVFCGTGKTVEEAIGKLYAKMSGSWDSLSRVFPDIPASPMLSELDEIIPVELADERPWYTLQRRDTAHVDPADDEWVYGNDAANLRWGHDQFYSSVSNENWMSDKSADDTEKVRDCAYIGVVRTDYKEEVAAAAGTGADGAASEKVVRPVYGILKYYSDGTVPETLHVGKVSMTLAGSATDPIVSKEGKYYLYYSSNKATASFSAPVTEIHIGEEEFINGYNTSYSCSSADRTNNSLPEYSQLRMRPDELRYIHTKYDMEDLPYIEYVYLGIGNTKKEAYADLIGTTNANAAAAVNLNNNSFSDKWIAFGYRRTSSAENAVKDVMLYSGSEPPSKFTVPGYKLVSTKEKGKAVTKWKSANVDYLLVQHNQKAGAETLSINEGNGDQGLYLYMMTGKGRFAYSSNYEDELFPIRNIAFAYGDVSPIYATSEQLASVYSRTMYGMKTFDPSAYEVPSWEYTLGVAGDSPESYKLDGSTAFPMDLNYGIRPGVGNNGRHSGDRRITMYVDRGSFIQNGNGESLGVLYKPRENASLSNTGYYSEFSNYGVLTQK